MDPKRTALLAMGGLSLAAALVAGGIAGAGPSSRAAMAVDTVPGMPTVPDPRNLYSETAATRLSPAVQGHLERIYVPNLRSDDVYVIDPASMKVVDKFKVGDSPQH